MTTEHVHHGDGGEGMGFHEDEQSRGFLEARAIDRAGSGDPLESLMKAYKWRDVWLGCISLAWHDEQFKSDLLSGDEDTVRRAIEERLDYTLPKHLELKIVEDIPENGWRGDTQQGVWLVGRTRVTMVLPNRPPEEAQAVALASYSGSDRSYPFSGF